MGGRPKYAKHEPDDFTAEEAIKLTAVVNRLDVPWVLRPRYEEDPIEAVRIHREAECAWWKAGVGIIVHKHGFQPALVMAAHGERR